MMATVPLLALGYVLMIKVLPTFLGTTWTALRWQFAVLGNLLSTRDALLLILVIVQMLLLALPAVGALYMFTLSSRRLLRALWRWSKPTLLRRLGGGLVGAAAFAVVTILWAPQLPWGAWWTTPARAVPGETARTAPRPGAAIGGVQCGSMEMLQHHTHTALTLYLNGHPVLLPANIGIPVNPAINRNGQPTCLYWLHTHDFDHALGIVHVESPLKRTYTLGQFLDIWQDTAQWDAQGGLGASVDATFVTALRQASSDAIHAYVNGRPWPGSYRAIPLHAHALITLEIGRPLEPPTTRFTFPAGE